MTNGIAMQVESSYQPAIRVGDTMRVSVPLLAEIHAYDTHTSEVVRVDRIVVEPDGTKTLWLTQCPPGVGVPIRDRQAIRAALEDVVEP